MADSGRIVKMEEDCSQAVDRTLPECQELAKVSYEERQHLFGSINEDCDVTLQLHRNRWITFKGQRSETD